MLLSCELSTALCVLFCFNNCSAPSGRELPLSVDRTTEGVQVSFKASEVGKSALMSFLTSFSTSQSGVFTHLCNGKVHKKN